jgi:hypothetical protein
MMKKNFVFGLFIIVLSIMAIIACGGTPPPEKEPAPAQALTSTPAPASTPTTPPPSAAGIVFDGSSNYIVVKGDTLSDIAARKYGGSNMFFFPLIRLANANVVPDPDVIEVNTSLVIPDLQRNLNNVGANALIREDMLATAAQYDRQGQPKAAAILRNLAARLSK